MLKNKSDETKKNWKALFEKRWFRNSVLVLVAAVTIALLTYIVLQLSDSTTTIVLINDSDCPSITLTLQQGQTGAQQKYTVLKGQQQKIEVAPEVIYAYSLNTESEPDDRNMTCFDRDSGTLALPTGSTQTIRVTSIERVEATPTTQSIEGVEDNEGEPVSE